MERKRARPNEDNDVDNDNSLLHCRKCGSDGPFYESSLAQRNYLCKRCLKQDVHNRRNQDAVHILAHRLQSAEKRRCLAGGGGVGGGDVKSGRKKPRISFLELVARVYETWNGRSVISGENDPKKLCVIPYHRGVPCVASERNCVLVTCKEARSLSHLKSENEAHARFPEDVRKRFEKQ